MIIVKIITPTNNSKSLLRQLPIDNSLGGNIRFCIDDDSANECDYCVVLEDLNSPKSIFCPPKNLMLFTLEPPSIKGYQDDFLNQFNKIITCHKKLNHKKIINSQQGFPWHIGINWKTGKLMEYSDFLGKIHKNKLISVICSDKKITTGHRNRLEFCNKIKSYFGDTVDFFGRGFNEIDDKWQAIAPYKYHIVIENESLEDYWTEKLSDCFLGEAYPIYYGANNISSYFSSRSITKINIKKPNESIKIIEKVINSNFYEKYYEDVLISKQKVLNEYNIFSVIEKLIRDSCYLKANKKIIKINPQKKSKRVLIKTKIKQLLPKIIVDFYKKNK